MDSCFSGVWAHDYYDNFRREDERVFIFCSSKKDEVSIDAKDGSGGLFTSAHFKSYNKQSNSHILVEMDVGGVYKGKKYRQHPICYDGDKKKIFDYKCDRLMV